MSVELKDLFFHPGKEYSPVPFWFLNGRMDRAEHRRQLLDFRAHGVWGAVLHPRMGFDPSVAYLSETYFDWIEYIVDTARELGMYVFLYDEGMYPSGAACGQVVAENPEYAARGLTMTVGTTPASGQVIARIADVLNGEAYDPAAARLLAEDEQAQEGETLLCVTLDYSHGTIRGLLPTQDDGLPDAPPAADLLDPEAVQCFIRLTHERYYARMSKDFGVTILAMFTDEPSPTGRCVPHGMRAWTRGLEAEWLAAGHQLTELPALFMEAGTVTAAIRDAYEQLIEDRMLRVYYQPLRSWCEAHGIALTGHPAHADSIGLEQAFTIPGQDMVWGWVAPGVTAIEGPESTQGHCAADSMLHSGKRRCLDECFGCCGPKESQWGMTVADMRWMMDFLFVRGVNWLAPHAFFYEMDPAISAQDRPPDVGPSNYWWPHFGQIAAYMTRMSATNAVGKDLAKVAVLTDSLHLPWQLTTALQQHQIPFHYLEVRHLDGVQVERGSFRVAGHEYRALVAAKASWNHDPKAQAFLALLANHQVPVIDAADCGAAMPQALLAADAAPVRLTPECADIRVAVRQIGDKRVMMLVNEGLSAWEGQVELTDAVSCECWDAWTGRISAPACGDGWIELRLEARQSILLVTGGEATSLPRPVKWTGRREIPLFDAFTLTLPDGTERPLPVLCDWQTLPGLEKFNGSLVYTLRFSLDKLPARAVLSLGRVCEIAEVSINGSDAFPLLLPPFEADVTEGLVCGENVLTVRVTSAKVTDYEGKPWVCGLMGPVMLALNEI